MASRAHRSFNKTMKRVDGLVALHPVIHGSPGQRSTSLTSSGEHWFWRWQVSMPWCSTPLQKSSPS